MEILETISVGETPDWLIIPFIAAVICGLISMLCVSNDTKTNNIISFISIVLAMILFIGAITIIITGTAKEYHDEYVVKISDDYPATKFNAEYEITKEFEYSDVIQVKKRD